MQISRLLCSSDGKKPRLIKEDKEIRIESYQQQAKEQRRLRNVYAMLIMSMDDYNDNVDDERVEVKKKYG